MRQTPFGVWNSEIELLLVQADAGSNEADAFWRLEFSPARPAQRRRGAPMRQTPFGVWNRRHPPLVAMEGARSNEADAFWRLE